MSSLEDLDIKLDDIPTSIEEFFTAEEYAQLCDYQKLNYSNLRQNYEMLKRLGKRNISYIFMLGPPPLKILLHLSVLLIKAPSPTPNKRAPLEMKFVTASIRGPPQIKGPPQIRGLLWKMSSLSL